MAKRSEFPKQAKKHDIWTIDGIWYRFDGLTWVADTFAMLLASMVDIETQNRLRRGRG